MSRGMSGPSFIQYDNSIWEFIRVDRHEVSFKIKKHSRCHQLTKYMKKRYRKLIECSYTYDDICDIHEYIAVYKRV